MRLSWFINAIFARPVPDCCTDHPPWPPLHKGGKVFVPGRFPRKPVPDCSLTTPPAPSFTSGGKWFFVAASLENLS